MMRKTVFPSVALALICAACSPEVQPTPSPDDASSKAGKVPPKDTSTGSETFSEDTAPAKDKNPLKAGEKLARCVIKPGRYDGECVFRADPNGSFYISKQDQSALYAEITVVSVIIIAKAQAEVFGLTKAGINSRWGSAQRSNKDRACWVGADFEVSADFEVCAY